MTKVQQTAELSALVLAAGSSSRYGQCKQLVEIKGVSLVRIAIDKLATVLPCRQICVVTGANAETVTDNISDLPVDTVYNEQWQTGLASSLKAGIKNLKPDCPAVLITLCDQVLVRETHLQQLIRLWSDNPSKIIASAYSDTLGTPAIIPADFYPQLLALQGDTGAKSLLQKNITQLVSLSVPEAEFDIDTPADLQKIAG